MMDILSIPNNLEAPASCCLVHPFEQSGCGVGPFSCIGCHDAGAMVSTCKHCGHDIRYEYQIRDSEGKRFIVGSDCVLKTGVTAINGFKEQHKKMTAGIRAVQNQARVARKFQKVLDKQREWKTANAVLFAWMETQRFQSNFISSLLSWIRTHGELTPGQQSAAVAAMKRHGEVQEARYVAQVARAESAPVVTVEEIEKLFAKALSNRVARPKLRIANFQFKPASQTGVNPGAIYVTDRTPDRNYLGKILNGRFFKVGACGTDTEAKIVEVCKDPQTAIIAHGKEYGQCSICGRQLEDAESVARGVGPICADNYGL